MRLEPDNEVKVPTAAEEPQITVPLIVPPEIVALPDDTLVMIAVVITPFVANKLVDVVFVEVELLETKLVMVPLVEFKLVMRPLFEFKVLIVPEVAVRFVVFKTVVVTACKEVLPSTVKVEVTVEEAATKPPNKLKVAVVVAPTEVICDRLGVAEPAGQLVPFERQTDWPLIVAFVAAKFVEKRLVEVELVRTRPVPVALVKANPAIVPDVVRRLVMMPLLIVLFVRTA